MESRILEVIKTLNLVEAHGESNLYYLLGSIQELQAIASDLQKKEVK